MRAEAGRRGARGLAGALAAPLLALAALLAGPAAAQSGEAATAPPPAVEAVAPAAAEPPAPRISVLTMEPGEAYWARFGHNALLVEDPATGLATSYNFGYFDFDQPGFLTNFLKGEMRYRLLAIPAERDIALYRDEGRGVTQQVLDLAPAQARALAAALAENARPENAEYTYRYFDDNCSTRVRDALDAALGGALRPPLAVTSLGLTRRMEATRLGAPLPWLWLGMDVGLGPDADRVMDRWDEAFVPMRLRDALREVRLEDGRALVALERTLVEHRLAREPLDPPQWRWTAFWIGAGLALGALALGAARPRALAALALAWWSGLGLLGLGLAALWLFTAHTPAHGNENLLLASPLALALLPGAWALARGRDPGPTFRALLWVVAGLAGLAGFLKFLPFRIQDNVAWVWLLMPLQLALAWRFGHRED